MAERGSRQNKHGKIAAELLSEIEAGKYPVGGGFPAEAELQARFGVGRHTIRLALAILVEQGLIGRRRRAGTAVLAKRAIQRFEHSLRDEIGLTEIAQATTFEISRYGVLINDGRSNLFNFDQSAKRWARYAGVRSYRSDHTPLCWSEVLVPTEWAPTQEQIITSQVPMYELVMSQQDFSLAAVEQNFEATQLTAPIAKILMAQPESAGLLIRRRYINEDGVTFQLAVSYFPAERYSVRTVLTVGSRNGLSASSKTVAEINDSLPDAAFEGSVMRFV
jgi:GntR family transcriptional regulator